MVKAKKKANNQEKAKEWGFWKKKITDITAPTAPTLKSPVITADSRDVSSFSPPTGRSLTDIGW